uniref:Uncharacterized protein n=1 Tax=Mola mola TaxID=94237 RepID=A0A3Q3W2T9_MOLML
AMESSEARREPAVKSARYDSSAVDGDIVILSAQWERRRTAMKQLHEQQQLLPAFVSELDVISANIAHLEGDFEEMESRLVYLETLCCQCEELICHLFVVDLNSQYAQKVADLEQAIQKKLKEQQKVYEEAFNEDMKQYLSTGYLHCRGKYLFISIIKDNMYYI